MEPFFAIHIVINRTPLGCVAFLWPSSDHMLIAFDSKLQKRGKSGPWNTAHGNLNSCLKKQRIAPGQSRHPKTHTFFSIECAPLSANHHGDEHDGTTFLGVSPCKLLKQRFQPGRLWPKTNLCAKTSSIPQSDKNKRYNPERLMKETLPLAQVATQNASRSCKLATPRGC